MRQEEPPEVVLEKCAKRLDTEVEAEDERATLYVALAALSSLRFPKELILKVLEVIKLENLPLFDGIREEWEAKGEARGEARGEEKGILKGRKEVARNLLLLNSDIETIIKATGLTKEQVEEIKKQIEQ